MYASIPAPQGTPPPSTIVRSPGSANDGTDVTIADLFHLPPRPEWERALSHSDVGFRATPSAPQRPCHSLSPEPELQRVEEYETFPDIHAAAWWTPNSPKYSSDWPYHAPDGGTIPPSTLAFDDLIDTPKKSPVFLHRDSILCAGDEDRTTLNEPYQVENIFDDQESAFPPLESGHDSGYGSAYESDADVLGSPLIHCHNPPNSVHKSGSEPQLSVPLSPTSTTPQRKRGRKDDDGDSMLTDPWFTLSLRNNVSRADLLAPQEPPSTKRKRGRPKGSRNKPKIPVDPNAPKPPKRGQGRPRERRNNKTLRAQLNATVSEEPKLEGFAEYELIEQALIDWKAAEDQREALANRARPWDGEDLYGVQRELEQPFGQNAFPGIHGSAPNPPLQWETSLWSQRDAGCGSKVDSNTTFYDKHPPFELDNHKDLIPDGSLSPPIEDIYVFGAPIPSTLHLGPSTSNLDLRQDSLSQAMIPGSVNEMRAEKSGPSVQQDLAPGKTGKGSSNIEEKRLSLARARIHETYTDNAHAAAGPMVASNQPSARQQSTFPYFPRHHSQPAFVDQHSDNPIPGYHQATPSQRPPSDLPRTCGKCFQHGLDCNGRAPCVFCTFYKLHCTNTDDVHHQEQIHTLSQAQPASFTPQFTPQAWDEMGWVGIDGF